jgi:hypothetical protein
MDHFPIEHISNVIMAKKKDKERKSKRVKKAKSITDTYLKVDDKFRADKSLMTEFKKKLERGELKKAYYACEEDEDVFYYKHINIIKNG